MTDFDMWPDPVADAAPAAAPAPRDQLAAEAVWWDAVADEAQARGAQAREQLEAQARAEFTRDRVAPTWRIEGIGTVPLSLTGDRVDVVDEAAYRAWVAARHPDNIETITQIRPAFDKAVRTAAAKRKAACTAEGEAIPGLQFVAGGVPKGIAVRAGDDAKASAAALAGAALDGLFEARTLALQVAPLVLEQLQQEAGA